MTAVRREVEELQQVLRRCGLIKAKDGLYRRTPGASASSHFTAQARALAHELDTLTAIVTRLDKATAPPKPLAPTLPREGTVARAVLEVLEADRRGHDHDHLRMLVGLTDAELVGRISGAGANSVRPRRVELVRRGLVELAPGTGPECEDGTPSRWRTTDLAYALLVNAGAA